MDGHANHGGAQHAVAEAVAGTQLGEYRAIGMLSGFDALDGLVLVGVEFLPFRFNSLEAQFGEGGPEAAVNPVEAFAILFVGGVAMGLEGALEIVEHGEDGFDGGADGAMMLGGAVALDALAIIFKI